MKHSLALTLLLSFSCGGLTNERLIGGGDFADHPRQLQSIGDFASVAGPQATTLVAERAVEIARRGVPASTFIYSVGHRLWTGRQVNGAIVLESADAAGVVQQQYTLSIALVGTGDARILGAAGDEQGRVWLSVEEEPGTFVLVAVDPVTSTTQRRLGMFSGDVFEEHDMPLAYADGLLFAALDQRVVSYDVSTGAQVADYSGAVAATGVSERSRVHALAAGHGRLLIRMNLEDTDTLSIDLATGQTAGRIADVPVGALTGTSTSFAGLDATGQAVFFDLEPIVAPNVIETVSLPRTATGLTAYDGLIFVMFPFGLTGTPAFVGFDPNTLQPVGGFSADPDYGWDFGTFQSHGLASDGQRFYLVRGVSFASGPVRGHIYPVEISTGDVKGDLQYQLRSSNACLTGGKLWLSDSTYEEYDEFHRPVAYGLDPSNGVLLETRVAQLESVGPYSGLLCTPNDLLVGGESTRTWVSLPANPSQSPARFMHAFTNGRAGIEAYGYWWILDVENSTLSKLEIPSIGL